MKIRTLLLAFVATMMVFIAWDKEPEEQLVALADNTLVCDGVVYESQPGAMAFANGEPGFVQLVLQNYAGDGGLTFTGNLYQNGHNCTFDFTNHIDDITVNFHILVQNGEQLLDIQYQNNPENFYGFLDGEILGSSSAYSSGTATITVEGYHLLINSEVTLINGKSLECRIVTYNQIDG